MNFLKRNPWIWLVLLFSLSLIPWIVFICLSNQRPMHRTDKPHPTPAVAQPTPEKSR